MLELQKFVLQQVFEEPKLFRRELVKSIKWLSPEELDWLKPWVLLKFGNIHPGIIKEFL
jgi:hypothetical protein